MEVLEEWRPVIGYEDDYEVSNLGVVRSLKYGKVRYLKSNKMKCGYLRICLCKNNKTKSFFVHRLAYTAFNGTVPEGMQLDHIDGDKSNNALSNLRVVTPRENQWNPVTRVHHLEAMKNVMSSEEWCQKNRDANRRRLAKPVLQLDKVTSEVIREWPCAADAARGLGINHRNISSCCLGKRKTAGGYRWCFILDKFS